MGEGKVDLWEEALRPFLGIKEELDGAIVFLDEGAAEMIRWSIGGASFLFQLGALNVLPLPPVTGTSSSSGSKGRRLRLPLPSQSSLNLFNSTINFSDNDTTKGIQLQFTSARVLFFLST